MHLLLEIDRCKRTRPLLWSLATTATFLGFNILQKSKELEFFSHMYAYIVQVLKKHSVLNNNNYVLFKSVKEFMRASLHL